MIGWIYAIEIVSIGDICEFTLRISILEFAYTCVRCNAKKKEKRQPKIIEQ